MKDQNKEALKNLKNPYSSASWRGKEISRTQAAIMFVLAGCVLSAVLSFPVVFLTGFVVTIVLALPDRLAAIAVLPGLLMYVWGFRLTYLMIYESKTFAKAVKSTFRLNSEDEGEE